MTSIPNAPPVTTRAAARKETNSQETQGELEQITASPKLKEIFMCLKTISDALKEPNVSKIRQLATPFIKKAQELLMKLPNPANPATNDNNTRLDNIEKAIKDIH